jgi:hypothetical protein
MLLTTLSIGPEVKLTPAQFREALGISQETLRHWRKALPMFQGRNGHAPAFTPGDLVAGAVVKLLRDEWGISVSAFADQSVALGEALNHHPWSKLSASVLHLSLTKKTCIISERANDPSLDTPTLSIPLAPLVEQITSALWQGQDQSQPPIYFPPVAVELKAAKS